MNERIELIDKRQPREKYFLNPDGSFTVNVYDHDVHFEKNGHYENIDTKLEDENNRYINKNNTFISSFDKNNAGFINIEKDNFYLRMMPKDYTSLKLKKEANKILMEDVNKDIKFEYTIEPSKLKESIILGCKELSPQKIEYTIDTNLTLKIENDKIKVSNDNEIIFVLDTPFMYDATGKKNHNVYYELVDKNTLNIILDESWLKSENTIYPVIIDPTIINDLGNNVEDVSISSAAPDNNLNNNSTVKVGVENNSPYRILLKFILPNIGTGFDIINATGYLKTYRYCYYNNDEYLTNDSIATVHAVTSSWSETTATWNNMATQYNPIIEDTILPTKNNLLDLDIENNYANEILNLDSFNITNLVKKWYSGMANNGIMIKQEKENIATSYVEYYSKTSDYNNNTENRAYLTITYRNQNGLEDYMSYNTQTFSVGSSHVNNLTGNLVTVFDINNTVGGKMPVNLRMIYNTNDVVLNKNYGYRKGYKLNFHQTIKPVQIQNINYLEYIDEDSTIHYFTLENDVYIDEDGLGLIASLENNKYVITDQNGNKYIFTKLNNDTWYLSNLIDSIGNECIITYDSIQRIIKIEDANKEALNILYNENEMIISSPQDRVVINYVNNKIDNIVSKIGTTRFTYNSNDLVETIVDISKTGYKYEYYDVSPYKVFKITELGLNNTLGESLTFEYGFKVTRITNNEGIVNTLLFNDRGNTIGITNLKDESDLSNAHGQSAIYYSDIAGEFNKKLSNKLIQEILPIKFTKNLLSDSSFENLSEPVAEANSRTGNHAYSFTASGHLEYNISFNSKQYTFSGYLKNDKPVTINYYLSGVNSTSSGSPIIVPVSAEFKRFEFTFSANENDNNFEIEFTSDNGNCFLDDVQLEEGEVANYHNLVDNSDFSDGLNGWEVVTNDCFTGDDYSAEKNSIVTLASNTNAIKMTSGPSLESSLCKNFNIAGKAGEIYNLSFWYKNTGIIPTYKANPFSPYVTYTHLNFNYNDEEGGHGVFLRPLNIHADEWQFYSDIFIAEKDYHSISLFINNDCSANDLYITNVSLTKNATYYSIQYDETTGLPISDSQNNKSMSFSYDKNNQLISMFDPKGNKFKYEYDSTIKTRLINSISANGIANEIKYDENNNPVKTLIRGTNEGATLLNERYYYIRQKGTNKYLYFNIEKYLELKNVNCNIDAFQLIKNDIYFNIKINNLYLGVVNNELVFLPRMSNDTLFLFTEQDNGSYIISLPNSNYCLAINNNILAVSGPDENDNNQFYFEDINNVTLIENTAEYSNDGKVIKKTTDSLGKETLYDIDSLTGLVNSYTNPKGQKETRYYDEKDQLKKVIKNKRNYNIEYDDHNLLSKIITNNKEYKFTYDDFLNEKDFAISNHILSTKKYFPNNGLLKEIEYANGSKKEYSYDAYNRLNTLKNDNKVYTHVYDNSGNLRLIKSINENYKYDYDLSKNIIEARYNDDFIANYKYDSLNNIVNKKHQVLENIYNINYLYNKDNDEISSVFDNICKEYKYDSLGRLKEIKIGDKTLAKYEYCSRGNKTSFVIKSIELLTNKYYYSYDDNYNLISMKLNNKIINRYYYDEYDQLIKEIDYTHKTIYEYKYDISGNIISKKYSNLDTGSFLHEDNFAYNDESWNDKLTKYNDKNITYDQIGNILSLGNASLEWKNGKSLSSYKDTNSNLYTTYDYDISGIRNSKVVNGIRTDYYLENNNIVLEKTGNSMIYYLRDSKHNLYGFKYNNSVYYYLKNYQNDVIGIVDSDLNVLCNYEYDSWGNILSIKDNKGNLIIDNNHVGNINPFRYRSYYYDKETNLYYLNSRYYSPALCRFINADGLLNSNNLTYNLYNYCCNNPVNAYDTNGTSAIAIGATGLGAGVSILGPAAFVTAAVTSILLIGAAVYDYAATHNYNNHTNNDKKKKQDDKEEKNNSVYVLVDKHKMVRYVGITDNIKRREYEHKHSKDTRKQPLKLRELRDGLTRMEARSLEEAIIWKYKMKENEHYYNKYHSISPKNENYEAYLEQGLTLYEALKTANIIGEYKWK